MTENARQHRRQLLERLRSTKRNTTRTRRFGLSASDPIVIASFFCPQVRQRFTEALRQAGIPWATKRRGMKTSIMVRYAARAIAWQILDRHTKHDPDRKPWGSRRSFDFLLLGGVLGTGIGIVSLAISPHPPIRLMAWVGFLGTGLVLGAVADQFARGYRFSGRLQFHIRDCLVLTTVVAFVLACWTLFFAVFW